MKNWNNDIQEAYKFCEKMAKSHYENFPVGSLLIPKSKRPYVWSIYAFARTADDFADENYPSRKNFTDSAIWTQKIVSEETERLLKLNDWEKQLYEASEGKAQHPIFVALGQTIRELKIPLQLLVDLLTAFKMDVTKRRYQNWEEVLYYCKHSADPVGRLILRVFGHEDFRLDEMSDAICSGLQLANFWQDIAVDREKDRIYVPLELLKKHRIGTEDLFEPMNQESSIEFSHLLKDLGAFTLPLFIKGKNLPLHVKGRLAWELKCTWLGGMDILQRACFNPDRKGLDRPKIRSRDKLKILYKSFVNYGSAKYKPF